MSRLNEARVESGKTSKDPRRERGQSLIEFALTAPVLIVLLLGLVEMGHAFNSYMTIVAAARDSARLGAQIGASGPSQTDTLKNLVVTETERLANAPIPTTCNGNHAGICITTGQQATTPTIDRWVRVKVCYSHSMVIGVPGILGDTINMCSSTKIRIANPGG
jgi:hypothetical protein